jgi:hypothetical protein
MEGNSITLKELLDLIRRDLSSDPKLSAKNLGRRMLRLSQTADQLAESAGKVPETAGIRLVVDGETEFLKHLHEKRWGTTASSLHVGRRNMLLRYAQRLGLLQPETINSDWDAVVDAAGYERCMVRSIITYAKIQSLSPAEFTQIDLDRWRKQRVQQEGIAMTALDQAEKAFRRALRKGNLQKLFPKFNAAKRTQPAFSLFMENMEQPLKADVRSIVEWARAEAAKGSLRIGESIRIQLEALCGYAVNILQIEDLDSVDPLLTEAFLTEYVHWLYAVRGRSRASVRPLVSGLHTILLHHPRFAEQNITWWPNLLGHIDREPNSATEDRREERALPYEKLLAALKRMRRTRLSGKTLSPKPLAWMVHDELLMMFAVLHVWHPGIIRSCRVNDPAANVFKREVRIDRPGLKLTPAAEQALKHEPSVDLWQFDFEPEWGVGAFGIVIDPVALLLDEYMGEHRKVLVGDGEDPGTLFFCRRGGPLCKHTLKYLIAKLTHSFAGKRVTADTMRISFTDYWLIEHQGDYVTLANILMISLDSVQQRFNPDYQPSFNRGRSRRVRD